MKRVLCALVAAGFGALAGAAAAQEADIQKAVNSQTLAQQFGDSIKGAKAEDDVKKAASDLAKQGDQACNAHDYDAGMDQIRQAMQQVGLKPTR
jgi:Ni/Co efflux regulator RcnB